MEERLEEAAKAGDIDTLYALIQQDRKLLEGIDEEPFIDSPLHIAAFVGCTHFALEIMRLKPSFGRKLNPDGLSPLDLALRNGHTNTVKRLINYDPNLIRVKGREGITPLHYVVESDDIDLLAEFLITCPESIKHSTIRDETAVHIAVKNGRLRAFKVLLGWLQRTDNEEVLNWKDENGNAALHLATSTNQPEILKLLIGKVKINEKNLEGSTALDIAMRFPRQENETIRKILGRARASKASSVSTFGTLADFLSSRPKKFEEWRVGFDVYMEMGLSGDMRNALQVVAVLIATTTYQALLQPPGGISQGDNPPLILDGTYMNATTVKNTTINNIDHGSRAAGKVVMPEGYFYLFIILNSIAFAASLGIIFALLPKSGYNMLLYISLWFMSLSYMCSGLVISPQTLVPSLVLDAAYILFILIASTSQGKRTTESTWVPRRLAKAYNRREIARSVFLSKYSEQRGR